VGGGLFPVFLLSSFRLYARGDRGALTRVGESGRIVAGHSMEGKGGALGGRGRGVSGGGVGLKPDLQRCAVAHPTLWRRGAKVTASGMWGWAAAGLCCPREQSSGLLSAANARASLRGPGGGEGRNGAL